jgi:hypothetical protein
MSGSSVCPLDSNRFVLIHDLTWNNCYPQEYQSNVPLICAVDQGEVAPLMTKDDSAIWSLSEWDLGKIVEVVVSLDKTKAMLMTTQ